MLIFYLAFLHAPRLLTPSWHLHSLQLSCVPQGTWEEVQCTCSEHLHEFNPVTPSQQLPSLPPRTAPPHPPATLMHPGTLGSNLAFCSSSPSTPPLLLTCSPKWGKGQATQLPAPLHTHPRAEGVSQSPLLILASAAEAKTEDPNSCLFWCGGRVVKKPD